MNWTLTTLALAAVLAPRPARAQEDPAPTKPNEAVEPMPVVSADELVMERFTPQYSSARQLFSTARELVGAKFRAQDSDRGVRKVENLRLFHDTILVYDTAVRARNAVAMLEKLDRIAGEEREKQNSRDEAQQAAANRAAVTAREYRPKFLTIDDLFSAVNSYRVRMPEAFSFVENSGFMVVTGSEQEVDEVLGFLGRIDVAAPQLLVTCFLVRGTDKEPENPAPEALARGLRELVGYEHLEVQARSFLRTSARADHLSLRLDLEDDQRHYELAMRPASFDPDKGGLTLERCELLYGFDGELNQVFRTQTTIYTGEYTVLGATGVAPQFIVLQCLGDQTRRIGGASEGAR